MAKLFCEKYGSERPMFKLVPTPGKESNVRAYALGRKNIFPYIVRQEYPAMGESGIEVKHRYFSFNLPRDFGKMLKSVPEDERTFHEVLVEDCQRRLYVDIDYKPKPRDNPAELLGQVEPIAKVFIEQATAILQQQFTKRTGKWYTRFRNEPLTEADPITEWNVFSSSNESKISLHFVAQSIVGSRTTCLQFAEAMKDALGSTKNAIHRRVFDTIDLAIYKPNNCFRLTGMHKLDLTGKPRRTKRVIIGKHCTVSWDLVGTTTVVPAVPTEVKEVKPLAVKELTTDNADDIKNLVLQYIGKDGQPLSHQLKVSGTSISRITFVRRRSGLCPCCDVVHDTVGGSAIETTDGAILYSCYNMGNHNGKSVCIRKGTGIRNWWKLYIRPDKLVCDDIIRVKKPLIDIDFSPRTVVVKSGLGTGKTKALREYLYSEECAGRQIIIVTPRISLAQEFTSLFPDFELYSDFKGDITSDHQRVIVQFESLHRIRAPEAGFILVLDEIAAILKQVLFGTENTYISQSALECLACASGQLIALDGGISKMELDWVKQARGEDISLTINSHQSSVGKVIDLFADKESWLDHVHGLIRNAAVEPVVIPCGGRRTAEALDMYARARGLRVRCYTQKSTGAEKDELRNCALHWKDLDVLIYSPTITVGINFELPHFHHLAAIFGHRSVTAADAMQMLRRVRNVVSPRVSMFISGYDSARRLAVTDDAVREAISAKYTRSVVDAERREYITEELDPSGLVEPKTIAVVRKYTQVEYCRDTGSRIVVPAAGENRVFDAFVAATILVNKSRMNLGPILLSRMRDDGYTIEPRDKIDPISAAAVRELDCTIRYNLDKAQATKVAAATPITDEKADELSKSNRGLTADEQNQVERAQLRKFYGVKDKDIDVDFVRTYSQRENIDVFKVLKLFRGRTWQDVIDNLISRDDRDAAAIEGGCKGWISRVASRNVKRGIIGISLMTQLFGDEFDPARDNIIPKSHAHQVFDNFVRSHNLADENAAKLFNQHFGIVSGRTVRYLGSCTPQQYSVSTVKYCCELLKKTLGVSLTLESRRSPDMVAFFDNFKRTHTPIGWIWHPNLVSL